MSKTQIDRLALLFESRFGLVLETARRYAPKSELARDIAQQSFIVFAQGAAKNDWDLDRDVNPLLYGIVKNVAMQHWERERKHSPEALADLYERLGRPVRENEAASVGEDERIAALRVCMEKLSPRNRTLLRQHYAEGIKTDELADRNHVKGGAIRQLFCRLRAKLRECIEQAVSSDKSS